MENTFFENLKKQSYSFFRGEQRGIALLLVFFLTLSFTACDGFFTDNNLEEKISAAIAYENAQNISVTVAPENVLHGRVTTGSPVSAKIGYPFNINFIVDSAYTFGGWAAYSNFISINDEPLSSEYVEFSDEDGNGPGKSASCQVTIKKPVENLWIVPVCGAKPAILRTEPLTAEKDVSITTPIRITFNKKMDLASIQKKRYPRKYYRF